MFEYVKTSVDEENKFRKIKSMQHVLVALKTRIIIFKIFKNFQGRRKIFKDNKMFFKNQGQNAF